ncbi:MAG: hypothetical protein FJ265_06145 [Planctomycetes bacterium]|nr:hypothetical protein [Planctomycetota bacterium]
MLKRLFVDNYKCLVNFEVEFQESSLLLGANGSGKSSILDIVFALRLLLSGLAKVTDAEVFPTSTLTRWQQRTVQVVELVAQIGGEPLTYRIEIEHEKPTRRARLRHESLHAGDRPLFTFLMGEVQLYKDDHKVGPTFHADPAESGLARVAPVPDNRRLTAFLDWARKILVCGLYPRSFLAEASSEDPLLGGDGRNFTAWYRHIFQERQDLVPRYVEAMKKVLRGFEGIRLERVGQETRAFTAMFREAGAAFSLGLDELSDGQRALVAIYALVHVTAGQGYTLFLDEPENYVTLAEIQPWLDALTDAAGHTIPQAILCSHHPELIDYFGCSRSLLLAREESGFTRVRTVLPDEVTPGSRLSDFVARGWVQ